MTNHQNRIEQFFEKAGNNGNGNGEGYPFETPTVPGPPGAPPMPGAYPYQPQMAPPPPPAAPPAPEPQLQAAPPDSPPPPDDDDGDDGDDWFFPPCPPIGTGESASPFGVRHLSSTLPENPMYVVATVPYDAPGVISRCDHLGYPPPNMVAFWVFPVQYIELQVRQYFRPPMPSMPLPHGVGFVDDHDEKKIRKLGWLANPPITERWPVFQYSSGGHMIQFDDSVIDTPYSDWRIVTVDRHMQNPLLAIENLAEQGRMKWLHPKWLENIAANAPPPFSNLPTLYEQARATVPMICATPGWCGDE